uniref:BLOC-1-related complex subunit 5 n=1 Tax=Lygus hesperus TaxID=30085 RepID=A0A0A9Y6F5_LYGHE
MGSEQSSQGGPAQKGKPTRMGQLRRGKSVPEPKRASDGEIADGSRPGSCSPGLSVCSDSDLPYISYTVNRPIGDSPKLPPKQSGPLMRGKSMGTNNPPSPSRKGLLRKANTARAATNSVVVVKPALKEEGAEKDPDIIRLQKIPMFLPIMRGTLNLPAPRDPEILERLDPNALYKLCLRCEKHLHECATLVAGDQHLLALQIKEIDSAVAKLHSDLTERQKAFAKHADNLAKINDITNMITKCHAMLDTSLEAVDKLNNLLPEEERLEPFVWASG